MSISSFFKLYVGTPANNTENGEDDRQDLMLGLGGDDTLDGRGQGDTLIGGAGNDILYGGDGNDTLLVNAGNDRLEGGQGNDTLIGGAGRDELFGGTGNDILTGGAGKDNFAISTGPNSGHDVITDFTLGEDWLFFDKLKPGDIQLEDANGSVVLRYAENASLTLAGISWLEFSPADVNNFVGGWNGYKILRGDKGSNKDDVIRGKEVDEVISGYSGNDTLHGNGGDDAIWGGIGNDIIHGGNGADRIYGGAGQDTLYGGGDEDQFVFDYSVKNSRDTIKDFNEDIIEFANTGSDDIGYDDLVIRQEGAHTHVTYNGSSLLILENTIATQITADDFDF